MWKKSKSEDGFTVMDTLISLMIFSLLLLCLIKLYGYTITTLDVQVSSGDLYSSYMNLDYKLDSEIKNTAVPTITNTGATLQTDSYTFSVENGVLFINGNRFGEVVEKSSGVSFFTLGTNIVHVSMYLLHGNDKMLFDAVFPIKQ